MLQIRPIYHQLQRRIESHITINFISYKIYKELERLLKEKNSELSLEKALDIAKTIYQIQIKDGEQMIKHNIIITDEQKELSQLFEFG